MAKKMFIEDGKATGLKVLERITQAAIVVALGFFIARSFFFYTTNSSKSMEPTIQSGSIVFINQNAYAFQGPERFDVVSFRRNGSSTDILTRRVIGLPGETIRIYWGTVYIDGQELDVSEYLSEITSDGNAETEIKLGSDEYFVIGDQPANSEDSRMSTVGAVNRKQILGKAWLRAESITELKIIR